MRTSRKLRTVALVLSGLLVLGGAEVQRPAEAHEGPSAFAAPWAIIAHGPRLEKSVTMADWNENLTFMVSLSQPGTPATAMRLVPRPYIELALFWGTALRGSGADSAAAVARLRPEQADGHARLYLAQGDAPAAVVFGAPPTNAIFETVYLRVVDARGLAVLSAHGIPARLAR